MRIKNEDKKLKNVYKENLFIMKLLTTHSAFLNDVDKTKKKLKIPKNGFMNERKKNEWLSKNLKRLPPDQKALEHESSLFYNTEALIKKYKLRYNFLSYLERYILFGKIDAPKYNFDVSLGPDPRGFRSNKWVSIKAYAPLTKEEIKQATKRLLKLQREFLPDKVTLDLRPKINIDQALSIEKRMEKRIKETREKPKEYFRKVRKTYGEKKSKEAMSQWRQQGFEPIEREVIRYTSKEIAEEIFGTEKKAPRVRQIYSRLKQKRKQLFG